jgi:small subunit ribosomal protein S20
LGGSEPVLRAWGAVMGGNGIGFAVSMRLAKRRRSSYNRALSFQNTNRTNTMANSAQARKRARQANKQRAHNMSLRSTLRTAIKKVRKAIEAGDKTAAQAVFKDSQSVIDSIADKNIVHKNKAARDKSRLSAAIKAMQ